MTFVRWLGEKLGLVRHAEDALLEEAASKVAAVAAVSRAERRYQLQEYVRELEASGQAELAAHVRRELEACGLIPATPVGVTALPAAPRPALPAAAVPDGAVAAQPTVPRKRGRPRKNASPGTDFHSPGPA